MARKSKEEYFDKAWNPITGCAENCAVCPGRSRIRSLGGDIRRNKTLTDNYLKDGQVYVLEKEFKQDGRTILYPFGFEPTIHKYRFSRLPYKSGHKIMVGSTGEIFGPWIKDRWLEKVFQVCEANPQHIYLFLTNFKERYESLRKAGKLPAAENMWYGIYDFGWPTEIPDLPDTCHKWLYADVTGGDVILARKKPEWVVIQCRAGLRDNDIFDPGILENRIQNLSYQCAAWKIPFYITPGARKFLSVEEGKMDWPEEMIKYLRDNLHTKEQERILYTECDICRKTFRKREMYPIDTRKSGMGQKNVGYVCQECASILEQEYGFRFSRLEEAHEKTKL